MKFRSGLCAFAKSKECPDSMGRMWFLSRQGFILTLRLESPNGVTSFASRSCEIGPFAI